MDLPARSASERWDAMAPMYEGTIEQVTSPFVEPLLAALHTPPNAEVADIACGTGVVTSALVTNGATVSSLDFSPQMLEVLRSRLDDEFASRVDTVEGDAAHLPWDDDRFDAAVSNFGAIFCPDVDAAVAEMCRVVRPGGRVALSVWTHPGENAWTAFLPDDHATRLGFDVAAPHFYHWHDASELETDLRRAGLVDVAIDLHSHRGRGMTDSQPMRAFLLNSPVNREQLQTLSADQLERLADLVASEVEAQIAEHGEAVVPANAWIAAGTVA